MKAGSPPYLVLASGSPRRQEFLLNLGLEFEVIASHIDESTDKTDPAEIVCWLSLSKAREVAGRIKSEFKERTLVLGSDTIVVLDKQILGKPESTEQAYEMLMSLSGKEHQVFTGVSIVEIPDEKEESIYRASSVFFRSLRPQEARYYAESGEPMDKAGAYALQGMAAAFVEKIEGCYSNIIGLPVPDTVQLLRRHGMTVMGTS